MPSFNVPEAMKPFYDALERAGFVWSTLTAPDEWHHPVTTAEVKICHVSQHCEIRHREDNQRGWTVKMRPYGLSSASFQGWLGRVAGEIVGRNRVVSG